MAMAPSSAGATAGLTRREWAQVAGMAAAVVLLNVVGWALLTQAVGHHFHISQTKLFGLGTGVLAYTLGMRHAFDADHIAAIDNTTRKLVGDGQRPLGAGFFFSLGHSSVVLLLALAAELRDPGPQPAGQPADIGPALGDQHRRNLDLRHVPLPDRPGEPVRAPLDRPVVPADAIRALRPRRAGAPAGQAGAHEPPARGLRAAHRHLLEAVPSRVPLRPRIRHRHGSRTSCHRRFGGRRRAPAATRSFRSRCSSPRACAPSTRWTASS